MTAATSMTAQTSRRGRRVRPRRQVIALGTGATLAVLGGGAAWALGGSSGPSYRLASVTRSTISQTVTTTGTIAALNAATLRFPVGGTVHSVGVHVGDTVRAGQTVARLDAAALDQQLQAAKAAAAAARQTLANDQASQLSGDGSSSNNLAADSATSTPLATSSPSLPASKAPQPNGPSTAELVAAVRRAQQKLLADQHTADLDADVVAADKAIVAANTACAALLSGSSSPTPTATSSSSQPTATDLKTCQDAITAVQAAQARVQDDIHTLISDEKALDQAVSALVRAVSSTGSTGGPSNPTPTPTNGSGGNNGSTSTGTNGSKSPSSSNGSGTVTATQLAADQKQVDAADAHVALAQQALDQASLTSSISGTVAAVSLTAGESVAAGSSTATITVIGAGQESVKATVGIGDIGLVQTGQAVTVTVDGVATPLHGHVTVVGVLNDSGTSGSSSTYPVTIVLDTRQRLFDGAGASVDIAVGSASDVLTVPTSAVHGSGANTTVTLYRGGKTETRRVTLGARGSDRVEIRSGLAAGDRIVLADLGAAVPTSDDQGRLGRNGGGLGNLGGGPVVVGPKGGR